MPAITDAKGYRWFETTDNVNALARWLVAECEIITLEGLIYYYSAPWKYEPEWNRMQEETNQARQPQDAPPAATLGEVGVMTT